MSRFHSYHNTATFIIDGYFGDEPFHSYLKKFFSANKKYGGTDRKVIAHLCYCFFRPGKTAMNLTTSERIITGLFLSSSEQNEILGVLRSEWNDKAALTIEEKEIFLSEMYPLDQKDLFILDKVFPWPAELSDNINHVSFCRSFFQQPGVYLRIRPAMSNAVVAKAEQLIKDGVVKEIIGNETIIVQQQVNIEKYFKIDQEVVVQDLSSQFAGRYFAVESLPKGSKVWDCCAGSGGKSIMAYDRNDQIDLTVSDKRTSIISNLQERFSDAGIKDYHSMVIDLSKEVPKLQHKYDLIIADLPCTGSGTWSRTPEQLYFFEEKKINEYAELQMRILDNVVPQLKEGGRLVYITCSVFRKENENITEHVLTNFGDRLKLETTSLLKGYDKRADSMYVAVFTS